ncbi:MAG: DUF4185 domain-containing protein [Planctomycetota bacterium]|nr:MAG: DUF4185 domain-containing protein [Planctomycetota bacterium]
MRRLLRIHGGIAVLSVIGTVLAVNVFADEFSERSVDAFRKHAFVWDTPAPEGCPAPQSEAYRGLLFTGRFAGYTKADTWYPSWGDDDRLYTPWTDGSVDGLTSWSFGKEARIGFAVVEGDDPQHLSIVHKGLIHASPAPYGGRYPCGSLMVNGVWFIGTYGLAYGSYGLNWPIMGPCGGFHISTDRGKTWTPSPLSCEPRKALFPEPKEFKGPVKFGAPHFVDFGKNMEHSPDGKAYLVGHGSTEYDEEDRKANLSWISGDEIYLCRVPPTIEAINDESRYEYFAGFDAAGNPQWSADFEDCRPIFAWDNNCGCVTMTYNAPLRKYFMCITDGWPTTAKMRTYILESDRIEGPWKLVTYLKDFGEQGYFVNIPSKFISDDGKTFWLSYSANFTNLGRNPTHWASKPYGSQYQWDLAEVRLLTEVPGPDVPRVERVDSPLDSDLNLALKAEVSASSVHSDYTAEAACDGKAEGYPEAPQHEWASQGEKAGAWIKLSWSQPQTIDRVWLFDRPNRLDHVTAARIEFSDGTTYTTGPLADQAFFGTEVRFSPKQVEWVKITAAEVGPKTLNIGFAEVAVFNGDPAE